MFIPPHAILQRLKTEKFNSSEFFVISISCVIRAQSVG